MPKYDGKEIYKNNLTCYQEDFCQNYASGMSGYEAYIKAYPNNHIKNRNLIDNRVKRLFKDENINKRLSELKEIAKIKGNQIEDRSFLLLKENPKEVLLYRFYEFVKNCGYEGDRSNEHKGLESIAKLLNLYGDGNSITNNQLNQIIINSDDVAGAIESIHKLVNKQ